ncbi:hypothetical protein DYB30_014115, partial [Aphanomyces astaci]
ANEVDLNRNWPTPFKEPKPVLPSSQTYPGTSPFSEPEAKGIGAWLHDKNSELAGWVDVHSAGGFILYPYGDIVEPIGNGDDAKFERLGRKVATATGFVVDASTIRTRGTEIFKALTQFAEEVENFDVNSTGC